MVGARPAMRSFWKALKAFPCRGRRYFPAPATVDLDWWLRNLNDATWKGSRTFFSEMDYPLVVFKSDASGEIGYGYHFGTEAVHAGWMDAQR